MLRLVSVANVAEGDQPASQCSHSLVADTFTQLLIYLVDGHRDHGSGAATELGRLPLVADRTNQPESGELVKQLLLPRPASHLPDHDRGLETAIG